MEYVGRSEPLPDRVILWPNYSLFGTTFEWIVPIDDTNTLAIYQHCTPFYAEKPFRQDRIPFWWGSWSGREADSIHRLPPRDQDFFAWSGQGALADRTREHLGASDIGVVMFRKKLLQQLHILEKGGELKAIVRDRKRFFIMLPESVPSGPERDGLPGAMRSPADIRTIGYAAGFPERYPLGVRAD